MPFPSLLGDIPCLALKQIGLSHRSQGSNTVEEDITVRTRVTDCLSEMLDLSFYIFFFFGGGIGVKIETFIHGVRYLARKIPTIAQKRHLIGNTGNGFDSSLNAQIVFRIGRPCTRLYDIILFIIYYFTQNASTK